ncbi:MAG TPA: DinB family protein [Candidatus Limnocylindrales bacterium]
MDWQPPADGSRATWIDDLELDAPDVVAAWRGIEAERFLSVRREVRRRAGAGSAEILVGQLAATAAALVAVLRSLPDEAFGLPGGEADWTVAEAVGHDAAARAGLVMAAGLAAAGRWPADAPTVVPSVPGPNTADRDELIRKLEQSQRIIVRSAGHVARHEDEPCPLDHPLVGRLRCGEWLLFAGVHDVMHLEQLHRIAVGMALAAGPAAAGDAVG